MYRNNSVRSVGVPEFSQANAGDVNSVVLAANAYYDPKGTKLGSADLRPYAGAGLAYIQELDTDIVSPSRSAQFSGNGLGFQLLAGDRRQMDIAQLDPADRDARATAIRS